MAASKRLRFAVFKRDRFTCSYCGRKPPQVTLEADHIIAVSDGGPDTLENLTTACFDCNRGKADIPLTSVPKSLVDSSKVRCERLAQMAAMRDLLEEEAAETERGFRMVSDAWMEATGYDPNEFILAGDNRAAVMQFMKRMPLEYVIDAAKTLWRVKRLNDRRQLKYFCGVCWSKIREAEGF